MKKKSALVLGATAVVLLLAAVYLWWPSSTPAGQDPLATLTPGNFTTFEESFDAAPEASHVVLLLSPT
jgi:hypothetical protein